MSTGASLLPVFLKLEGRRCAVIGAGAIALAKIESLLASGARVRVVAPSARAEVRTLAEQGRVVWEQHRFTPEDLDDTFLVIAATDDPAVNHTVHACAVQRNILVNAVDDPPFCDFYFSSVVKRGALQIAISTAGESPALAQQLRREIDALLPQEIGPWLKELGELRREVLATHPPGEARTTLLHTLAQKPLCPSETCPARALAHVRPERREGDSWWIS